MNEIIRFAGDLLVIILVAFPPFLYLYRYLYDRVENLFLRIALCAAYWAGTLTLSNIVPSVCVLFLIHRSRKEFTDLDRQTYETDGDMTLRRFNLDCTDERWRFSPKTFIKVSIWGVFIKYVVSYINIIVIELLSKLNVTLTNQEIVDQFMQSGIFQSIIYSVLIVICAPMVEEFAFRFWMYDRLLKKRIGRGFAAVLTSLLFMSAHFNIQGAVTFFLIGIINCYLYDRYGYWGAVANHFVFNFISTVLLVAMRLLNLTA